MPMIGPPRILIAPDKFKGTLSGAQAAAAIASGIARVHPEAEIRTVVIADGGEGTVDAAMAAGAERHTAVVAGPLDDPVTAEWARLGDDAVIELASASGLQLVPAATTATALAAHTEGVGQLIRAALDVGVQEILVGVGGSAGTDGGTGALRALGGRFLDRAGREIRGGGGALGRIASIDLGGLDSRLSRASITVVCDVSAPLLGSRGAAAVFGPQKGADAPTVALLEDGLANLAARMAETTGRDMSDILWGGAAGGTAGGLYAALDASFAPGIEQVAALIGLDALVEWADVVVVGEGSLDAQSLQGKGPIGVVRKAIKWGRRTVAVAGRITLSPSELTAVGLDAWAAAVDVAPAPGAALGPDASRWVSEAAARAAAML
ncbi:glycerate kinase [Microbacterium sp. X-17]|uniref:glycerate kinase n=1 Tax=Microbacterium sp. X-17 TaxID=3144404 RepID=UPI0031F4DE55